jgi:hypothetical protein
MKRTLIKLAITASISIASVSLTGSFAFAGVIGPVDVYMDLASSTVGSNLSTSTLNAGTIGSPNSWFQLYEYNTSTTSLAGMTVQASHHSLLAPVMVGATPYPSTHVTHSIALNNNYYYETAGATPYPSSYTAATVSGWVTFGPPAGGFSTYDYIFLIGKTTGSFIGMQLYSGTLGSSYYVWIESGSPTLHSTPIEITPGGTYWFSLKASWVTGVADLALYDTSGSLVATTTEAMPTGDTMGRILVGNNETGAVAATSTFEDLMIDYSHAAWPLSPLGTTIIGKTMTIDIPSNFLALNRGLVGYWNFDGKTISGTTAADSSGNANNGTLVNSPRPVIGKIGQALQFNGTNQYVSTNVGAASNYTAMTVSAWIYYDTGAPAGTILSSYDSHSGNSAGPFFSVGDVLSAQELDFYINDGSNPEGVISNSNIPTNQWIFVTGTWDGTFGGPAGFKLYINGVATSTTGFGSVASYVNPTTPLDIGTSVNYDGSLEAWEGALDDVRIYNRALSAQEVQQLYALGSSKYDVSPQVTNTNCSYGLSCGLVGYWTFNGGKIAPGSNNVLDSSGNGNNGTEAGTWSVGIGKVGQAAKSDGGSASTIAVPPAASINNLTTMTFCAWVKVSDASSGFLFSKVTGVGLGKYFFFASTNVLQFAHNWSSGEENDQATLSGTITNKWTFLCVSYDGTAPSNRPIFYQNAIALSTTNLSTGSGSLYNDSSSPFELTNGDYALDDPLLGYVDEARYYNRVLSPEEIQQLYNAGSAQH